MKQTSQIFRVIQILPLLMLALIFTPRQVEATNPSAVGAAPSAPIDEVEPNDTSATAQLLTAIGLDSPVNAEINPAGDTDWFAFNAEAGQTYAVEIFNAATGLGGDGTACDSYTRSGLGLLIYDPSVMKIAGECNARHWTGGNMHHRVEFTTSVSGVFYIKVKANNGSASGYYSLRVLPYHDDPGAVWDAALEPNNGSANAYLLEIGYTHALTTDIEVRNSIYSTYTSDEDWYRFEGEAGSTYVVELFNAAVGLGGTGSECEGYSRDGVGLLIYDSSLIEPVAGECQALSGSVGNTQHFVAVTASITGIFYVKVKPNVATASGGYSIRLLAKYDEPDAAWDAATFEPNNQLATAYMLSLGYESALTSTIEPRDSVYSTYKPDRDWYAFEGSAGATYVVELFDVASNLKGTGSACYGYSRYGVGLLAYGPDGVEIAGECGAPNGTASVHHRVTFVTSVDGMFHIQLSPNADNASGAYHLRVCQDTCLGEATFPWREDFNGARQSPWQVWNEDVGFYSTITDSLQLRTNKGDLYQTSTNYKNLFLIANPTTEDFDLTVRVIAFEPTQNYAQFGLLALDDVDNYVRFAYGYLDGRRALESGTEIAQVYTTRQTPHDFGDGPFYLRLRKEGAFYSTWYSTDGERFVSLNRGLTFGNGTPAYLGFTAISDPGENTVAQVDWFELAPIHHYFDINGQVNDIEGQPLLGVIIGSDAGLTVTTDADGYFTFVDVVTGSWTITPWLPGYVFTPTQRVVSVPPTAEDQTFTAGKIALPPGLHWSTFAGSDAEETGNQIARDAAGNLYIVGVSVADWGTPVNEYQGGRDIMVTKFNADGVRLWHTFLGSTAIDDGYALAVDTDGSVYVTGHSVGTWGTPVRPYAGGYEAFVAKLDTNGELQWNTFLGSSGNDGGRGIAVDNTGNVYVIGESLETWGSPVRGFAGTRDSFVAKLDATGALQWHTFLGGSNSDVGSKIAMNDAGVIYATGLSRASWGSPLASYPGSASQADWVVQLGTDGALQWLTFIRSAYSSDSNALTLDGAGNLYLAGWSDATWGAPVRAYSGGWDAYVVKLNSSGQRVWHTFLGSADADMGLGIAVDALNNVYVAGISNSSWGAPMAVYVGGQDAFVARLSSGGQLRQVYFLGGAQTDYGYGVTAGDNGDLYVTGHSQTTWEHPINPYTADMDAFVAKVNLGTTPLSYVYLPLVMRSQ